jgi:hypothetical protein
MGLLANRIGNLEARQPADSPRGAMRFIWHGPSDDAALAAAYRQAEADGRLLIERVIVGHEGTATENLD